MLVSHERGTPERQGRRKEGDKALLVAPEAAPEVEDFPAARGLVGR